MRQLPPVFGRDVHVIAAGGRLDTAPRLVAVCIAHSLHLVKTGHRVAHVAGIDQRFFALLGKCELAVAETVLVRRAQTLAPTGDVSPVGPGARRTCRAFSRLRRAASFCFVVAIPRSIPARTLPANSEALRANS